MCCKVYVPQWKLGSLSWGPCAPNRLALIKGRAWAVSVNEYGEDC